MRQPYLSLRTLVLAGCFLLCAASRLFAQEANRTAEPVSEELIKSRISAVETAQDIDEQVRAYLLDKYKQASTALQTRKTLEDRLKQLEQLITETRRTSADALKRQIESISSEPIVDLWSVQTADEADEVLRQKKAEFEAAKSELKALDDEIRRRAERRTKIPQIIAEKQKVVDGKPEEPPSPLPAAFEDAPKLLQTINAQNARLEIEIAQKELEYFKADEELLPLRRELAQRKVNLLEKVVALWTTRVQALRDNSISLQAEFADRQLASAPEPLKPLAKANVELVATRKEVATGLSQTRKSFEDISEKLEKFSAKFEEIKKQVGTEGEISEAVGTLLIRDRKELPDVRALRRDHKIHRSKLYEAQYALIRIETELAEFGDMDRRVEQEIEDLKKTISSNELEKLRPRIRGILQQRLEILKELKDDYESYVTALGQLIVNEENLIQVIEEYGRFVDERVLWIRSIPPVSLADIPDFVESFKWLASPKRWRPFRDVNWLKDAGHPAANLAWLLAICSLVVYRLRYGRHIHEVAKQAESRLCQRFSITLEVLIYTLLRSAAWPLVYYWIAWNLYQLDGQVAIANPLARALQIAAIVAYPIFFWLRAIRRNGLCGSHLNWTEQQRGVVGSSLHTLAVVLIPSISLFELFQASGNEIYEKSAGRFFFVIATLSIAWCIRGPLSPSKGVFANYLSRNRGGWFDRLKTVWYAAGILIPVSFAILAILGYQYTASELLKRFYVSTAFLSGLYIVEACARRWLLINHRRLAIQQARERLAQRRAELAKEESAAGRAPVDEGSEALDGVTESGIVDLSAVSAQSKRLLDSMTTVAGLVGLYFIWVSVLPAMAKLDDYKLWLIAAESPTSTATESTPAPVPQTTATETPTTDTTTESGEWITLGNVIISFVVVVMTLIAAQNIPGLMEIVLLQRLPLEPALRYAINSVTRYIIVIVGMMSAFSAIGIGWSRVQWLAAAVSVGLGFGLQEIFANFVSGLILLFERPLRAGDIVTVGDITGKVIQIKTRATTIRDWDCKELVVPNKEFITGKVLNWTLTNTINRIVVNVGIAYGSDVERARQIVLDVAIQHPLITDDPRPSVTFESFGDSSLNLTLRSYIQLENMDDRLSIVHQLHTSIHDRLQAAGIEIPFPQRDIHVRSIEAPLKLNSSSNLKNPL